MLWDAQGIIVDLLRDLDLPQMLTIVLPYDAPYATHPDWISVSEWATLAAPLRPALDDNGDLLVGDAAYDVLCASQRESLLALIGATAPPLLLGIGVPTSAVHALV